MTRHFQLKVTSPTTNIDVDSIDGLEVARIAQLAGIQVNTAPPMPPSVAGPPVPPDAGMGLPAPGDLPPQGDDLPMEGQTCSICGATDHSEVDCPHANPHAGLNELGITEEVAEYDHGHDHHSGVGEEVDPDTYLWQPKRAKQHFGKQADNTMDDPINEAANRLYHSLTEAYQEYLRESRENDTGVMSPLSDPDIEDFDKDPMSNEPVVDDGSRSPLSTVRRQPARK